MAKKKTGGLGRGLGALLSDTDTLLPKQKSGEKTSTSGASDEIDVAHIEANPYQPRTEFEEKALNELAESIKVHGIIQPLTLRKISTNKYQLIAGERRLRASQLAGLKTVPAFVREANDQQMLEMGLIENIQREDLNAIEIALSYQRLISECELKQEELGDRVGKERSTVTNYLRLLKLPPDIQSALKDKKISMGHARALINMESTDAQIAVFREIIAKGLSVRNTEQLVRNWKKPQKKSTSSPSKSEFDSDYKHIEKKLSSYFGTKVRLKVGGNNKGEVNIPFVSVEDLNRILEILEV